MPGVKLPPLKKGKLTTYGYSANAADSSRRASLIKAMKAYGERDVIAKLNALYVLNKNRPLAQVYLKDREFASKMYASTK